MVRIMQHDSLSPTKSLHLDIPANNCYRGVQRILIFSFDCTVACTYRINKCYNTRPWDKIGQLEHKTPLL